MQPTLRALALGLVVAGCAQDAHPLEAEQQSAPLTYWQDIAPLFAERCLQCHQEGGIAPLRLDDYAKVKPLARLIELVTRERTMPPWSARSDGTCGEFKDSIALTDAEIARIASWVGAGAQEGERAPLQVREPARLLDASELETPSFVPEIQGGELAAFDEYRCFELDRASDSTQYITGYEVVPGEPAIVHHVVGMLIDPAAQANVRTGPARTNLEQMRALDAQSPEREGWPCFGMAGEGLTLDATPVAWAPGQGVVRYPNDSGVPLRPDHKLIVQVHYNLADSQNLGKRDQTRVRLQLASKVKNVGKFLLPDPLLNSLADPEPITLPPGQASTVYSWSRTGAQLGLNAGMTAELYGVAPHMHERGRKFQMQLKAASADPACAVDVAKWDFHWQRMYFYDKPWIIDADTQLSVTCDYDTRGDSAPVRPGWGTRNEMCLAGLFLTQPL